MRGIESGPTRDAQRNQTKKDTPPMNHQLPSPSATWSIGTGATVLNLPQLYSELRELNRSICAERSSRSPDIEWLRWSVRRSAALRVAVWDCPNAAGFVAAAGA